MVDLVLITGNAGKAEQFAKYLDHPLKHQKIDLDEIQSLDLNEIIAHKAKQAYSIIKKPVLVDDTSVVVHALGKLPGPFIKWFIQEIGLSKLCLFCQFLPDRRATATVIVGFFDGKDLKVFSGEVEGQIAPQPRGVKGFGWDPIFIPNGYNQTRGEMPDEDYRKTSPRDLALKKLAEFLKTR